LIQFAGVAKLHQRRLSDLLRHVICLHGILVARSNGRILDGLNQAWIIVSKPTALPAIASGQGKFRLGRDCGWVGIITAS
jgi:hypothetical protein